MQVTLIPVTIFIQMLLLPCHTALATHHKVS